MKTTLIRILTLIHFIKWFPKSPVKSATQFTPSPLLRVPHKSLTYARKVNRVYPKSPVKSATQFTSFDKSAQTGKKTYFEKKVYNNHNWIPKISKPAVATAKSAITTARPKVSTGGSVNNKRVNVGNVVKASAHWEWKPKGIITSSNPNGVSMTFDRYNYIDTRGRSKSFVAWVSKRN
jgi:hypothetical protein